MRDFKLEFDGFSPSDFAAFVDYKSTKKKYDTERKRVWEKFRKLDADLRNESTFLNDLQPHFSRYWVNATTPKLYGVWLAYTEPVPSEYYTRAQFQIYMNSSSLFIGFKIPNYAEQVQRRMLALLLVPSFVRRLRRLPEVRGARFCLGEENEIKLRGPMSLKSADISKLKDHVPGEKWLEIGYRINKTDPRPRNGGFAKLAANLLSDLGQLFPFTTSTEISDSYIQEGLARTALPILIGLAQSRKTITYGELANLLAIGTRQVAWVAGYIRDEICKPRNLPLLNCLIVNKTTGFPGESWHGPRIQHLSKRKRIELYERFRDEVFAYADWEKLLNELKIAPLKRDANTLFEEAEAYNEVLSRRGGAGESNDHRRLKDFVFSHPHLLGLHPVNSLQEMQLPSGDEIDVAFNCTKGRPRWVAVEVKVGERGELVKGVFQAIKYRALLEAFKGYGTARVQSFLVAYSIPQDIAKLAESYEIETRVIPRTEIA
jgi:hypothetical protein